MKKIEKLIHINTDEKQHVSPDTVFEMCCKINEIIDFLNQLKGQQVELTNKQVTDFVKHTGQNRELNQIAKESEKQPEKCDCDYCKAYRFSMEKEPEGKCIHDFPLSSEGVCQKCGIKFEDIKSEKQEEGTFNKEELETLKLWGESLKFWELFVSDSDNALREKISKLLKEEE